MAPLPAALIVAAFAAKASAVAASSQEECSDVPLVWTDPDGDGCEVYGRSGWCGAPWTENFATIGRTASQACCVCGGGLRTQTSSAQAYEASEPLTKRVDAPTQFKVQDDSNESSWRPEPAKPGKFKEEPSHTPPKVRLHSPMVNSASVGDVKIGSFRKDEAFSLKAEITELKNALKDRDHMAATLSVADGEESRRAKAQEASLSSRLDKLEKEFHESQKSNSNAPLAPPSQDLASAKAELKPAKETDASASKSQDISPQQTAELMEDVGQLRGLVQETQVKLRGMNQQIAGLKATVTALSGPVT
jgi:hypothetical protein